MDYLCHILILIGIYIILSTSLNLLLGYCGVLSIAQAAFYGIGAYTTALLALRFHPPVFMTLGAAVAVCAAAGYLASFPALRMRGDFLVIATFAFQVILFSILNNCIPLTGGPMGLPGIPSPQAMGYTISTPAQFLVLTVCLCAITVAVSWRIASSPVGRVMKAIREDEVLAQSKGKDVARIKTTIFTVSSALAALAGTTYAYYVSFIDPTTFTVSESVFIISAVIVGGAGTRIGPAIGSVLLVFIPEILRTLGLPAVLAANVRQILYGLLLVLFMWFRPSGLLGEYNLGTGGRTK